MVPVWDCVSDRYPYCRPVRGTLDCSRSIERYSVAASFVATIANLAARTGHSDEIVADSVATADDDADDDSDDEDWSRSEN